MRAENKGTSQHVHRVKKTAGHGLEFQQSSARTENNNVKKGGKGGTLRTFLCVIESLTRGVFRRGLRLFVSAWVSVGLPSCVGHALAHHIPGFLTC